MIRKKNERVMTTFKAISLLVLVPVFLTACGNNRRFDAAVWLKSDARTPWPHVAGSGR